MRFAALTAIKKRLIVLKSYEMTVDSSCRCWGELRGVFRRPKHYDYHTSWADIASCSLVSRRFEPNAGLKKLQKNSVCKNTEQRNSARFSCFQCALGWLLGELWSNVQSEARREARRTSRLSQSESSTKAGIEATLQQASVLDPAIRSFRPTVHGYVYICGLRAEEFLSG